MPLRFNSFFGQNHDANFQNGDPTKWVIISAPIAGSPEGSNFYAPIIADPNPTAAGTIFEGSQSVWRTQDWGGDQAYLEANCPEFTTVRNPGAAATLSDRAGWRDRSHGGGLWYSRRRLRGRRRTHGERHRDSLGGDDHRPRFISKNADAAAGSVTYVRLDTLSEADPGRFVSGIYVDPDDSNHAWISYSGYNFNTPSQPGHVFEVDIRNAATATWTSLGGTSFPDIPATDVVRDRTATSMRQQTSAC